MIASTTIQIKCNLSKKVTLLQRQMIHSSTKSVTVQMPLGRLQKAYNHIRQNDNATSKIKGIQAGAKLHNQQKMRPLKS